jgi:hypothetical protein
VQPDADRVPRAAEAFPGTQREDFPVGLGQVAKRAPDLFLVVRVLGLPPAAIEVGAKPLGQRGPSALTTMMSGAAARR